MRSARVLSILVVGVLVCAPSSVWAQGVGTFRWRIAPFCSVLTVTVGLDEDPLKTGTTDADGVALRAIQALEARTRVEHERMLEDTQSLADESGSLVQENAERKAEIAALQAELMALRAEMAALKAARR